MKKLLITVNGKRYDVDVEVVADDEEGYHAPVAAPVASVRAPEQAVTAPAARPKAPVAGNGDPKTLKSPMNGVVLEVPVVEGQEVKERDVLCVIEAMKMKTNVSSPFNGKIKTVHVKATDVLQAGQALITYE